MTDVPVEADFEGLLCEAVQVLQEAGAKEIFVFGPVVDEGSHAFGDVRLAMRGLRPEIYFQTMVDVSNVTGHTPALVDLDHTTPFTEFLLQHGKLRDASEYLG